MVGKETQSQNGVPVKVLVIDGRNLVYRAAYRFMQLHFEGTPTGVLHGWMTVFGSLRKRYPDHEVVVVWDSNKRSVWRQRQDASYKANRKVMEKAREFSMSGVIAQESQIRKWLSLLKYPQVVADWMEADDMVGLVVKELEKRPNVARIFIYSSDRDFFQLISSKTVVMREPRGKSSLEKVTAKALESDYGLSSEDWVPFRALTGDVSDGIKSVCRGMGPKKALKMVAAGVRPKKVDRLSEGDIRAGAEVQKGWSRTECGKYWANAELMRLLVDENDERIGWLTKEEMEAWSAAKRNVAQLPIPTPREKMLETGAMRQFAAELLEYGLAEMYSVRRVFGVCPS